MNRKCRYSGMNDLRMSRRGKRYYLGDLLYYAMQMKRTDERDVCPMSGKQEWDNTIGAHPLVTGISPNATVYPM